MAAERRINRAKLAKLLGVTPTRVYVLCQKAFAPALGTDGLVNLDHPVVVEYFYSRGLRPPEQGVPVVAMKTKAIPEAVQTHKPVIARKDNPGNPEHNRPATRVQKPEGEIDEDVQKYLDYTLREIYEQFGTDKQFKDFLGACKTIEDVRSRRIENAEALGELIPRALVETHVFGAFEQCNTRLLRDQAKTIAAKVTPAARAGATAEEIERVVRDQMSAVLRPVAAQMSRALKNRK